MGSLFGVIDFWYTLRRDTTSMSERSKLMGSIGWTSDSDFSSESMHRSKNLDILLDNTPIDAMTLPAPRIGSKAAPYVFPSVPRRRSPNVSSNSLRKNS